MPLDLKPLLDLTPLDEEESTPPERGSADFMEPPPMPRPIGATGTWEDESGIPPEIGREQTRQLQTASEMAAARGEGEAAETDIAELERQQRSIGAFSNPVRTIANLLQRWRGEPNKYTEPLLQVSVPADDKSALAGVGRVGAKLVNSVFDPDEALKLMAFGGGAVPKLLATVPMAESLPDQVEHAASVLNDPNATPADITEAVLDPAATTTMLGLAGHSSQPPIPRQFVETMRRVDAVVPDALQRTKEAAVKRVANNAATIEVEAKVEPITKGETNGQKMQSKEVQEDARKGSASVPEGGTPPEVTPPREAPPAPAPVEAKVDTLAADVTRERAIAAEKKALLDSEDIMTLGENPKWMELSKEFEDIKNRYQGRKPSDVVAEQPKAQALEKGGNKITKETVPERVAVQADQVMENGETMPGYVTIQSKGNAQSGPVEAWRAAGHEIPDTAGLPSGTYTVAELKARANEKAIPATTEATTPTAADQTPIPARQAPVVEPRVGAVPENVPTAGATTTQARAVKPPAQMTAGEINKALDKLSARSSKLTDDFIAAGRGTERPTDYAKKTDPLSVEMNQVAAQYSQLKAEIEARYGPGAPSRLPSGRNFGPREKASAFFERESEVAGLGRSSLPPTVADVRAQRAADARGADTIETQPLDPASGAPIAPPAKPPAKPPSKPAAATPSPEPAKATLDDVYKIFEPAPKEGKGISQRVGEAVESFRTGFSSKFRPLNKLAEDIAAKVGGKARDVAGIFEQLKGSSGKAEADVYRFDKDVSDLVKGSEKDFNAYVFLRRSLDRLQQDAADITRAQAGENVPKLNRRRVSQYTIPQLEAKLTALSEQIGGEKLAQFNKAAESFQTHMDQALRLQVESGRMSPEVYDAIKAGNQFYAPFKVMKYIEETVKPEGSGRKVDTVADFTKAMEGIDDPNVKLGDMLAAARQNLTLSRTLAEKNRAMQNITELAALDVDGNLVQKLKPGAEAPAGMEAVNVLENGVQERYAVNSDVAQAVQNAGPGLPAGIVARWSSNLFRAGATTLNVAFQPVNLLFADAPRAALVSKYGVKGVTDLVRYPMDFVESLFSSISADVFGVKNKLFQDFLDSGAAGTTVQQYLTPEALRFKPETATSKTVAVAKTVLNTIPQFANAIEQTSKVLGVKRAMRIEGAESGAALAKQIPEAITEIRRFSGSPDFGRSGKWTEQYRLNLVYMFLNARIQGAVADVGRLTGRDGAGRAAKTWLKMGTAVGIPTAYLYMLNNSDEYKEDYAKRPEQEKQNYWLIPKDTFITGSNGEKIRDYWRVPKREIAQWMGNAVESGLDFANERDPDAFWKWAGGMAESIAPANIRGNTLQERAESFVSGLHPFIKAPIEMATGRDTYRHRNIVPDSQKKASPEQQFTDRTPEVFKSLANAMPDVAPEVFRSPLMLENMTKNFTAALLTQFLPRQPVEGRSKAENLPLTQRFQAVPYTDSSEFDQRIQKFERESADEQLSRMRDAKTIMDTNKGAKPDVLIQAMIKKHGRDEKMAERIVDLYAAEQRGITAQERRVLALPVTQRAEYLADELKGKTPEQKSALLRNWALKRILTERVAAELTAKIGP